MITEVRAAHILVVTEAKAREIMQMIKDGTNFADLARQYSMCPSKQDGGDLGWFERGMMVPEFEDAAFENEKGTVVGPVRTQFGYHVILVIDQKINTDVDDAKSMVKEVRAAHILVDKEAKAKELLEKIKGGASFADLAKQFSTCPSGRKGGDLGWFKKGMMVKEFEDAAFNNPKGTIVGPVKTQFGYHLIQVVDQK
jgi:peptidyl-prolyl cis-trans isomerase C